MCLDESVGIEMRVQRAKELLVLLWEMTLKADRESSTVAAGIHLKKEAKRILEAFANRKEIVAKLVWPEFTSGPKSGEAKRKRPLERRYSVDQRVAQATFMPAPPQQFMQPQQQFVQPQQQQFMQPQQFGQPQQFYGAQVMPPAPQPASYGRVVCIVCGKFGHTENTCFTKHPELKAQKK
jgi:hypothetical protein